MSVTLAYVFVGISWSVRAFRDSFELRIRFRFRFKFRSRLLDYQSSIFLSPFFIDAFGTFHVATQCRLFPSFILVSQCGILPHGTHIPLPPDIAVQNGRSFLQGTLFLQAHGSTCSVHFRGCEGSPSEAFIASWNAMSSGESLEGKVVVDSGVISTEEGVGVIVLPTLVLRCWMNDELSSSG